MKVESKESKKMNDEHNKERSSVLFIQALACPFHARASELSCFSEGAGLSVPAETSSCAPMPCRADGWRGWVPSESPTRDPQFSGGGMRPFEGRLADGP